MGKFHSTFSSVGNKEDFSPEAWRGYFDPACSAQWAEDLGGSIQFLDESGDRYSLIMNYRRGEGISMSYDRYNSGDFGRNFSMISQSGAISKEGFDISSNGATVPKNNYLSWDIARAVVEDFLRNPEKRPNSVAWVGAENLDWPEG
ncbi:Imm1 family immunity protein [Rhizobium sp. BR 362]|uniref:Imm1 family immunity protein n=1 Tax=Rhizobium sp. BR 362 TaxID=3040670 RepID=UPI002F40BB0E